MTVGLLSFSEMDEQMAIQEAASAGLKSMEHLVRLLSQHRQVNGGGHLPHSASAAALVADSTVSNFKNLISVLNRTGHARFRRGPPGPTPSSNPSPRQTPALGPPAAAPPPPPPQTLTLDFTKPDAPASDLKVCGAADESFSISTPMSSTNSSFMSSITGDGSVSNGKQGSSLFLAPAPAVSAGKPPLSSASFKKRCHDHDHSEGGSAGKYSGSAGKCHCSKRRKLRYKRTIRVPAISSRVADIPPDEFSWRKYGQKPIKGSPYPRGYYKCSSVRGCPARKHVERAQDDPAMLVVTYEEEHLHSQVATQENIAAGVGLVFESSA